MDLFEKCRNFSRARDAQKIGLYPYFLPLAKSEGTLAEYRGKELIMCGSNNYLGLTTHPEVKEAIRQAVRKLSGKQSQNLVAAAQDRDS